MFNKKQKIVHHILFFIIMPLIEIIFNLGRILTLGFLFRNDYGFSVMFYFNKLIYKLNGKKISNNSNYK